jgi:alkylation response protein AidB-like acyl-CoA dehydrogenase
MPIGRDARVERIWDGTSEIQRHIISRACCDRTKDKRAACDGYH